MKKQILHAKRIDSMQSKTLIKDIINHCLGLGHETMVCAVCLTMFLLRQDNANGGNM